MSMPKIECNHIDKCCKNDLLEVNKSVEDMVDKITALEIVLKSKLELIMPILEDCDKKPVMA